MSDAEFTYSNSSLVNFDLIKGTHWIMFVHEFFNAYQYPPPLNVKKGSKIQKFPFKTSISVK